jgi:hypothetical protein
VKASLLKNELIRGADLIGTAIHVALRHSGRSDERHRLSEASFMGAMASGGGGWVCDCPPVEQGWRIAGIWLMAEFGRIWERLLWSA